MKLHMGGLPRVKYLPLALLLAASPVAAINLISDPMCYDPSGGDSTCPQGFEFSDDEGGTWQVLDHDNPSTTAIIVWHDMDSLLSEPGAHSWLVRSENAWGVSEEVPFDFTVGVPVAPFGLRLVAPPVE